MADAILTDELICNDCKTKPERRINRQYMGHIDEVGCLILDTPLKLVDHAYYECKCGKRYTAQMMGEPEESWDVEVRGREN